MAQITIIIFHYDDINYLRGTVRQIERFAHPEVEHKIIIADQTPDKKKQRIIDDEFHDYKILHLPQCGSGFSVDYIMHNNLVDTKYVCTLDVDAWPIHKNWLYVPIKLIESGFDWVGIHAQIESAYAHNGPFYSMCMHFMVSTKFNFNEAAYFGGFTKESFHNLLPHGESPWSGWSDDGVIAHWWTDRCRKHKKLGLAVSHHLGHAPTQGYFGRYSDDLFWHMGFSFTGRQHLNIRKEMGDTFLSWMEVIRTTGLTDELCDEILEKKIPLASPIGRTVWENGEVRRPTDEENKLIDKLKNYENIFDGVFGLRGF